MTDARHQFDQSGPTGSARGAPVVAGFHDLAFLGEGGFSLVYRALQDHIDRPVAIKVFKDFDPTDLKARDRFSREARAMGRLSGIPQIVDIYLPVFSDDGRPCIVMPLLPRSLADRLATDGPLTIDAAVRLGATIAAALDEAHRRGIYHRDIKPENVLLDENDEPWLADFGIAVMQDVHAGTRTRGSLSPPHAPPERLNMAVGDQLDDRAGDIYSLGSTIYNAMVGVPPFGTAEELGVVEFSRRVMTDAPPGLDSADLPKELVAALTTALAKDPADRFSSAAEFGDALRRVHVEPSARLEAPPRGPAKSTTTARSGSSPERESALASSPAAATVARPDRRPTPQPDVPPERGRSPRTAAWVGAAAALVGVAILALVVIASSSSSNEADPTPSTISDAELEQAPEASVLAGVAPPTLGALAPDPDGGFVFSWSDPNPNPELRVPSFDVTVDGGGPVLLPPEGDSSGNPLPDQKVTQVAGAPVDLTAHTYCVSALFLEEAGVSAASPPVCIGVGA